MRQQTDMSGDCRFGFEHIRRSMVILTENAMKALNNVSSSPEAGAEWLGRLAAKYQKPIGLNGGEETMFMSPS